MTRSELRRIQWRGVLALTHREVVRRVLRLWPQTIAPQVIVAVLFVVVFGVALGSQIRTVNGVPYQEFVVPGLTLMGVSTAAFANNSTSLYQARSDGFIEDPVSSPMTSAQLTLAYTIGGVARGLIIGIMTLAAARAFVGFPFEHPLLTLYVLTCASLTFTGLGNVVGLYSRGWELQAFVGNIIIQPLVFLGGVFYSIAALQSPWRGISHADPILYMVEGTRHGILGTSDLSLFASLGVTTGLAVIMMAWSWWVFDRGVGLRT